MSTTTIYHNPRCSKSRATLALLQENGSEPEIMLYLERGPSMPELLSILAKLDLAASQIVRRGEEDYKTSGLNAESTDQEILAAIVACPKLLERPIVVKGDRAVLGRPPENVLVLLVDG